VTEGGSLDAVDSAEAAPSSDDASANEDASAGDASSADGGGADSGLPETSGSDATAQDASAWDAADSAPADASAGDGSPDGGGPDTGSMDSGPPSALPRTGWVASASMSLATNPPAAAIDGVAATRWTPGASQAAGQWFEVDMGTAQALREITIDAGASWAADYLRGYQVIVSSDGSSWSSPVATGIGASPVVTIAFAPTFARYVRVVLTAASPTTRWWSIAEFNVLN
jgi:beta-glucosidase